MILQDIAYETGGKKLTGYLAVDETRGGKRPGILVCHQGGGLQDHAKERARMLADIGYAAFALDMYGELATSRDHAMSLLTGLIQNPKLLGERAIAGLAQLKAQPGVDTSRLAAVGYCFGGAVVLELARIAPEIAAVVAFHPGLAGQPEKDERKVHAKVMVCAGQKDPLIPPEAREQFIKLMVAGGADWQLFTYGSAGHSFTDKTVDAFGMPGFNYDAVTDLRSWAAMRQLFDETFGAMQ